MLPVSALLVTVLLVSTLSSLLFLLFAGGNDKSAVVFNKDTEQVIAILQGHTKKVTSVIYHPEEVVIPTSDKILIFLNIYE